MWSDDLLHDTAGNLFCAGMIVWFSCVVVVCRVLRSRRERFQDVCLIDSLRAHGFKIPYIGDGPFWVIADGNRFLQPCQFLACTETRFISEKICQRHVMSVYTI